MEGLFRWVRGKCGNLETTAVNPFLPQAVGRLQSKPNLFWLVNFIFHFLILYLTKFKLNKKQFSKIKKLLFILNLFKFLVKS